MAEIGTDYFDPAAGGPVRVTLTTPLPVTVVSPGAAVEAAPAASITESAGAGVSPWGTVNRLVADGAGRLEGTEADLLRQLIREVRVTNRLLLIGLNVDADIDANTDTDYD